MGTADDGSPHGTAPQPAVAQPADEPRDTLPSGGATTGASTGRLNRRDALWVLRRCGRQGHVVAWVADAQVQTRVERPGVDLDGDGHPDTSTLVRCLRCGTWVRPDDAAVSRVVGEPDARVPLSDLPQPVRGAHGRKFALLRLLSLERLLKGTFMIAAAFVAYHVATRRASLLSWVELLLIAFRPLGDQLGLHLTSAAPVRWLEETLGGNGEPLRLAGMLLLAYGVLQLVEGVGLWGGWRWAEYLATVATALFVLLEVYEIAEHPTVLKVAALLVNLLAVGYLVYKGRLFGTRGGHPAYLAEVRDTTEMADVLRSLGRSTTELSSHVIV